MDYYKQRGGIIFLFVLAAISAAIWNEVAYFESRQNVRITFFDTGQGDAIFIEAAGNQILIDGGPGEVVLARLGEAMRMYDRSIDLIISTHPDADHLSGLVEVLGRYDVGHILETGVVRESALYEEWHSRIADAGIPVTHAVRGMKINVGPQLRIDILAPFDGTVGARVADTNKASIVALLRHGNTSVLFMGDAPKAVEHRLAYEDTGVLDVDILKVGHHGSRTSTLDVFLRATSPDIAVIQVGRNNRYGHPHGEVLQALAAAGVAVLRTDLNGSIAIESDGVHYWQSKK